MASPGNWINSLDDLHDFISFVILYAPDEFPEEDFLAPNEQLDLTRAFEEIRRGLTFLRGHFDDRAEREALLRMIDESLDAYRKGDAVKGAHLLQALEQQVFGRGATH